MVDDVLVGGLKLRPRLSQDKVEQRSDKNLHIEKLYCNSVRHQYEEAADSEVVQHLLNKLDRFNNKQITADPTFDRPE